MKEYKYISRAMELAVATAGHKFPELSKLAEMSEKIIKPKVIEISSKEYSVFYLDITVTKEGKIHLIEANGSNAALSSAVTGEDDDRVRHMVNAFRSKTTDGISGVALLAYQPNFLHIPEFFMRAGLFTKKLSEISTVSLINASGDLRETSINVVCDSIPKIADHVENVDGKLYFKGKQVIFGYNPNLLQELVRRDVISEKNGGYSINTEFYCEGKGTPIIHNKGMQQLVAEGTGITPLKYSEGNDEGKCHRIIEEFSKKKVAIVGKMNGGSGGTGIQFFPPNLSKKEAESRLFSILDSAKEKYGKEYQKSVYPIRFFEFAESRPYMRYEKPHLWDMRIQCLVYPGFVEVTPCVIRLCPEPFESDSFVYNQVVSNLSGREPSLMFMRSPFANRRSLPMSVLGSLDLSRGDMNHILKVSAKWCKNALLSAKNNLCKQK